MNVTEHSHKTTAIAPTTILSIAHPQTLSSNSTPRLHATKIQGNIIKGLISPLISLLIAPLIDHLIDHLISLLIDYLIG